MLYVHFHIIIFAIQNHKLTLFYIFRVELSSQNPNIYTQSPPTKNNNRNYYNVSDHGYKQTPSTYDAYYPIYDDDVELYHDGNCCII